MWSILTLAIAEKITNQIIRLDPITQQQLTTLRGKTLRVKIQAPRLAIDVHFDENKLRFEPSVVIQGDTPFSPTATLTLKTLVDGLKLLLSDETQIGTIPVQGDHHLLLQLQSIMQQTQIDLATALTPYLGAVAAHEVGKLQQIPHYVWQQCQNQAYILQDYLKEDSGLFAPRWQVERVLQEQRQLNQEIDRLEAKIQQLQSSSVPPESL